MSADVSRGGNNRLNEPPRDKWLRRKWNEVYGAGKGDSYRPIDKTKYDAEYDRIFGRCSTHPEYEAKQEPTVDCAVCRRLWRETRMKGSNEQQQNPSDR